MDAVVVEAVLEARAECSDADRARAALNEALLAARAPAHGGSRPHGARPTRAAPDGAHWTVTMTVARSEGTRAPKSVEAVILDDAGVVVAQRTLTDRSARACLPLARAVGAWASLVLDAEMNRAKDDDGQDVAPKTASFSASLPAQDPTGGVGREGTIRDVAAEPVAKDPPRTIELGTMVYLRNGMTSAGGIAGLAPFITVEVSPGWMLRPGLYFGRSTTRVAVSTETLGQETQSAMVSHLGARADLCRRIPGNYVERRGIELDLCGGVEGGAVRSDAAGLGTAGRFGIGPSANLRGELGAGLALEVRGLLGANLVNAPMGGEPNAPLVFAAGELGVSMRLP